EPSGRGTRTVNATKGMNVEEVRRMPAQLRDAAEEITRIEQELTSGLADVDWTGPDADRFSGQLQSEMDAALQQIMNPLYELGQSAERNASQQECTSSNGRADPRAGHPGGARADAPLGN